MTYLVKKSSIQRSWRFYPASSVLFVLLFVAGGMTGGSCADTVSVPVVGSPASNPTIGRLPTGGPKILVTDHVLGDANAPVTVVEYSDMECTICGRFSRNELPILIATYVNTGKIRYVFRHFPSTMRQRAEPAAMASECAAEQGRFFEYHGAVFADQSDLSDTRLRDIAAGLGLDLVAYDACVANNSEMIRVQEDITSAQALGVSSAPTYFINGEMVAGFQTADDLGKMILRKINELNGG